MIEELGLTPPQWEVYRALLWNPRASREELAEIARAHGSDLDADIVHLEFASLVVRSSSTPSQLRPVYPQVALQRLLDQKWDLHEEEAKQLRHVNEELTEFAEEFSEHRRAYEISLLNEVADPAEMTSRVNELVREAKSEILSFVPNTFSGATLEHARAGDRELLGRGVRARSIYLDATLEDTASRQYLHWLAAQGAFVRTTPSLPVRMIVFDGSAAVVSRRALDPGHGALIVQSQGLIAALVSLFEAYWSRATPLTPSGIPRDSITTIEHDILTLLAQGMKDDAIAHRLDVSVRTVRRALNQLYERTGSENRFELGVKATRYGWL